MVRLQFMWVRFSDIDVDERQTAKAVARRLDSGRKKRHWKGWSRKYVWMPAGMTYETVQCPLGKLRGLKIRELRTLVSGFAGGVEVEIKVNGGLLEDHVVWANDQIRKLKKARVAAFGQ